MLVLPMLAAACAIVWGILFPHIDRETAAAQRKSYATAQRTIYKIAGWMLGALALMWVVLVASQPPDTPLTWANWGSWPAILTVLGSPLFYLATATLRVQFGRRQIEQDSHNRYGRPPRERKTRR